MVQAAQKMTMAKATTPQGSVYSQNRFQFATPADILNRGLVNPPRTSTAPLNLFNPNPQPKFVTAQMITASEEPVTTVQSKSTTSKPTTPSKTTDKKKETKTGSDNGGITNGSGGGGEINGPKNVSPDHTSLIVGIASLISAATAIVTSVIKQDLFGETITKPIKAISVFLAILLGTVWTAIQATEKTTRDELNIGQNSTGF